MGGDVLELEAYGVVSSSCVGVNVCGEAFVDLDVGVFGPLREG